MRLFYFLARKISYTFALAFLTVFGGWVGATFGYFLGTSFLISSPDQINVLFIKWFPWVIATVTALHYMQFGMLTRLGVPAFVKSFRMINRYFDGEILRGEISNDDLGALYAGVSDLPLYNMFSAVFYAMLSGVLFIIAIYFDMRFSGTFDPVIFKTMIKIVGISAIVLLILYGMSTYLFTEIITGYERATCYNTLLARGIVTFPRVLAGVRVKFSFFLILMVLALLTFTALMEKSRFFFQADITAVIVYLVVAVMTMVFLMSVNSSSILRVLREMNRVAREISTGGDAEFRVISLDREFSTIEYSFVEMAREIREYRKNIEMKVEQRTAELQGALADLKERDDLIQKQLDIASTIQRGILPGRIDDWNELKFSIRYIAMEKIGGDFYDVYQLKGNKLGLLMADVSGHGIPAAPVTTMAKISFSNACNKHDSPRRIFQEVNQNIIDHVKTQDYLTCFFLSIDEDYTVTYANASHQKAILLRAGVETTELLDTNGLFIGAIEEARDTYEEKTSKMKYGDRLLLYTDGIPEAIDAQRHEYSLERLQAVVVKNRNLPLEDFTSAIIEDVQRFIGSAQVEDDITLVVVELARDAAVDIIKNSKKLVVENRYYEAIEHLERGLSLYPENKKLLYNLAKNYFRVN
ncbi:MAG: serine/threonine-protein phosphatase, partial [Spirochaetales bacterium]